MIIIYIILTETDLIIDDCRCAWFSWNKLVHFFLFIDQFLEIIQKNFIFYLEHKDIKNKREKINKIENFSH